MPKLEKIAGSQGCLIFKCPGVFRSEHGEYLVQGTVVTPSELGSAEIPAGEGIVRIPAELVQELVQRFNS